MKPLIIIALAWGIVHSLNYRLGFTKKEEKPAEKKDKHERPSKVLSLLVDLALFILAIIFVVRL